MNQEELRKYFGELCKDNKEINLNSIDDFWKCFNSNRFLTKFFNTTKKHGESDFITYHINRFFNVNARLCFCNKTLWQEISMEEVRLRCAILQYHFPEFMEEYFVPYVNKNKQGDIDRWRCRIESTKALYPDTNDPHHVEMIELAKYRYEFVKERYSMDLDYEVKCIQSITDEIRANEAQSQLPLTR